MPEDTLNEQNNPSSPISTDLWKTQQDYAWEWFKYHAKQRTDMFNYFLITTGLLINGYVSLRKDDHLIIASMVAFVGLGTSIGFFLLDCRNKQLIDNAASILSVIETKQLFTDIHFKGMGLCQGDADKSSLLFRHKTVFRGAQIIVAAMWIVFFIATCHYWLIVRQAPYKMQTSKATSGNNGLRIVPPAQIGTEKSHK